MTPEEEMRLQRLEEHFVLLVQLTRSLDESRDDTRVDMRALTEKIEILTDSQIRTDERMAAMAEALTRLADRQADTEQSLTRLIGFLGESRNGEEGK